MFHLPNTRPLWEALTTAALLSAITALLTAPQQAVQGARDGLALCAHVIVPSLFPFFVLSALVVDLGLAARLGRALEGLMRPLFRVSGAGAAAWVISFVGGYPIGARTALQLYRQGRCSREETQRLLAFCNNSGPAFVLGVVGVGVFGSGTVGLLLYLTHIVASLLVGLLFRFSGQATRFPSPLPSPPVIRTIRLATAFTDAVAAALRSSLHVCAFVLFFSVALRLLSHFGLLERAAAFLALLGLSPDWGRCLAAGLLELSSGVAALPSSGLDALPMAAFLLGWAGLSIHCQVLALLGDSGLSARSYLLGKLCHGLIAAALTALLIRWLPLSEAVSTPSLPFGGLSLPWGILLRSSLLLAGLSALFLTYLLRSGKNSGKKTTHRL